MDACWTSNQISPRGPKNYLNSMVSADQIRVAIPVMEGRNHIYEV